MSKSSSSPQGIIDLLDEPAVIRRKINRAVTDAESVVRADEEAKPGVTNLLRIFSALSGDSIDEIAASTATRLRRVQEGPRRARGRHLHPDQGADRQYPRRPRRPRRASRRRRAPRAGDRPRDDGGGPATAAAFLR